ncbi:sensor histidine kinase [Emticicia sp. SJ17W-69]|uniref:sensor histidine kinase n=1 Tax=Emticicia sp. SJ17W-69 TaxID=3421657 RepID=UPI003EBC0069
MFLRLLFIFLLIGHFALAKGHFDQIGLKEGLSQSEVRTILQDNDGYMWFGTQNGLNRYDGLQIQHFYNNPFEKNTLSNDDISFLYEDSKNKLWIGTKHGLNSFNKITKDFTRHTDLEKNNDYSSVITGITEDRHKTLWVSTYNGLWRLIPKGKTYKAIHFTNDNKNNKSLNNNTLSYIVKDKKGEIWLGSRSGLNKIIIKNDKELPEQQHVEFQHAKNSPNSVYKSLNTPINRLFCDAQNNLWITSLNKVFRLNLNDLSLIDFSNQLAVPDNFNSSIMLDRYGTLWLGTYGNGAFRYEIKNDKIKLIEHIEEDISSNNGLKSSVVYTIYEGKEANEDIVWIGTRDAGVHTFSHSKNSFKQWDKILLKEKSVASASVFGICKDSFGYLWVGTYEGLFKINIATNVLEKQFLNNNDERQNFSQAVFEDSHKNLWVGANEGLFRYNRKTRKFFKFNIPKIKGYEPKVMRFLEDRNHTIWVGTNAYLLKIEGKKIKTYEKTPDNIWLSVMALEEDEKGNLWLGTNNGLVKFNPINESFKTYRNDAENPKSLINDLVLCILHDKNNQIWVGSAKGLSKLVVENGKENFVHFTEKNGLPNNFIYGALPDAKGRIWLSTNNGISCFDPALQTFKNYSSDDGLANREFNSGAYFRAADGELFFGGLSVLISFNPLQMVDNQHLPKTIIASFKKFEQAQNVDSLLKKDGKVKLNYDENFFTFQFSPLDFTNPEKNQIAYQLENFDKDWVYCGSRRYINFANLKAGDYVLKVKSSNNQGIWNNTNVLSIPIYIKPPFWQTWWFFLLTTAIIAILVTAFYRFKVNRVLELERVKLDENERVRKIAAQDMHDEFGNSLTRISLLTELIKNKLKKAENDEALVLLSKIGDNANRLYQGTKDFIWAINPEHDNLFEIAIRIKDFCDETLDKTDIRFVCEGISDDFAHIKLPMGASRHLVMLFKEAIMNTLKHARATQVRLCFKFENNQLQVIWQDNGVGIQVNKPNNGNGLANICSRAEKIGGKAEINSKNNEGTTIRFIMNEV